MQDIVISSATLPVGATNLGPAVIPSQWIAAGVVVDKATWTDPADTMSLQVDFSTDAGTNWTPIGGWANEPGGTGSVFCLFQFPSTGNNNRRVRAALTVAGHPISATVSVRLLDGSEPRVLG